VNHTDDTVTLNKVNSVITQTDATDFKTLMLAIDYENHGTTKCYCIEIKASCNSQVSPRSMHTDVNQTKKLANTIKAKK